MAEGKEMMGKGGHAFFVLGVLAIVYGLINYLTTSLGWMPYTAWIVGGVILILVGWAKKSMKG